MDSELALARRCAVGDAAAVRLVTTQNNQRLYRAAWSILNDRSEAEDAVQSAYLKAFSSIAQFQGRSAMSTWLTKIVIHEALGRARTSQRRRSQLEARGVTMLDDHRKTEAPDEAVAREQLRKLLEGAIAALPAAFRTVFVLRDVEGLTAEDTSEALDIPVATVKTRLFRARRKLKEALAPEVRGALIGAFPFAGANCKKMTARVIVALGHQPFA